MNLDLHVLIPFLCKHFALVGTVMLISVLIQKRSASLRHAVLLIGFVWVALLPLLVIATPHITIPTVRAVPMKPTPLHPTFVVPVKADKSVVNSVVAYSREMLQEADGSVSATHLRHSQASWVTWQVGLLALYLSGVCLGLLRIAIHLFALRRGFQNSEAASEVLVADLEAAGKAVGLKRTPRLVVSSQVSVPMTFGIVSPTVVVPVGGASKAVLLHECAHIHRGDWLALMFARTVASIYWFDPLLLLAERVMRANGELAADDVVVLTGVAAKDYAEELVDFASRYVGLRYQAGLAIIGNNDLKSRVRQILRIAPRQSRIPAYTAAFTLVFGCYTVVPFAAMHLVARPIEATPDGFVDLGHGNWVRVLAITQLHGDKAVSWNMKGELLPRAIGPQKFLLEHPPTNDQGKPDAPGTHFLIFATNLPDSGGLGISETPDGSRRFTNGVQYYPDVEPSMTYPQTLINEQVFCSAISMPKTGTGTAYLTTPTDSGWATAATATFDLGRFTKTSDPAFREETVVPVHGRMFFSLPKLRSVQARLVANCTKSSINEDIKDFTSGEATIEAPDFQSFGDMKSVELKVRQPMTEVMLTNIPLHPIAGSLASADLPPGVEVQEAQNNQFLLSGSQMLTLKSVCMRSGKQVDAWTPSGQSMHPSPQEPNWDDGIKIPLGERRRNLQFSVTPLPIKGRLVECPNLRIFDASGPESPSGSSSWVENDRVDIWEPTSVPAQFGAIDLIVQVTDPKRAKIERLSLDEVYSEHKFGPATFPNYMVNGVHPKEGLKLTYAPGYPKYNTDPLYQVSYSLADSKGNRINTVNYDSDGKTEQYAFSREEAAKVKCVMKETIPYVFIRFRNVSMQPSTVAVR